MGAAVAPIALGLTAISTGVSVASTIRQGQAQAAQARQNAAIAQGNADRNRLVAENNKQIAAVNAQRVEAESAFKAAQLKKITKRKERVLRKEFRKAEGAARARGRSQDVLTSLFLEKEAEADIVHLDLLDDLEFLSFETSNRVQDIIFGAELQAEELGRAALGQELQAGTLIKQSKDKSFVFNAVGTTLSGAAKTFDIINTQNRIETLEESLKA